MGQKIQSRKQDRVPILVKLTVLGKMYTNNQSVQEGSRCYARRQYGGRGDTQRPRQACAAGSLTPSPEEVGAGQSALTPASRPPFPALCGDAGLRRCLLCQMHPCRFCRWVLPEESSRWGAGAAFMCKLCPNKIPHWGA